MVSAAAKVFAIPELLEATLRQLPSRDILLSQRVNKSFRSIVQTSPHLRRALFFDLEPKTNPKDSTSWTERVDSLLVHRALAITPRHYMCPRFLPGPSETRCIVGVAPRVHGRMKLEKTAGHESWRQMYIADPPDRFKVVGIRRCAADSLQWDEYEGLKLGVLADRLVGEHVELGDE